MLLLIDKYAYFSSLLVCTICTSTLAIKSNISDKNKMYASVYPYMVYLRLEGLVMGSGTILNKNYILTSVRSVFEAKTDEATLQVILGNGYIIDIKSIKFHEGFIEEGDGDVDIAILKTKTEIPVDFVKFVKLVASNSFIIKDNLQGLAITWRKYPHRIKKKKNVNVKVLRVNAVEIYNNSTCQRRFKRYNMTERYMCVAPDSPLVKCYVYHGGPVIYNGIQVGIITGGANPCIFKKTHPKVAIMISKYVDWINEYSNNNETNRSMRGQKIAKKNNASSFRLFFVFKTVALFCVTLCLFIN